MGLDNAEQVWNRPLTRRHLLSAVAAGSAGFALVGCGDDDDNADQAAQQSNQPVKGGKVTLLAGRAMTIADPHKGGVSSGAADAWQIIGNTLLYLDWTKGTVKAGLAEKWEYPDPTTLVLTLKKGVHFQQSSTAKGRELEASDVVASLERVRTPNDATFANARSFRFVDTYEALDKYTIRVKLKSPDANLISWLYYPPVVIVPKETIVQYGADLADPAAQYGTGPFVFDPSSYKSGISAVYKRNPNYDAEAGGLPYLDEITILWIADLSAQEAALRSGEADVGLIPTLGRKNFEGNYQIGSTEDTITAASQLDMNTELAPTKDPRVRQAIHRALDRVELVNIVGDGFGCTSMVLGCRSDLYLTEKEWDGKPGFRKDKKQDIEEAKKLLAAAGVDPTKTTLKLGWNTNSGAKVTWDQSTAVRGMLERNLGFKFELVDKYSAFLTPANMRESGVHLANHSDGGPGGFILDDPLWKGVHSTAIYNGSIWNDKKTDELVDKQSITLDLNERKKLWAELQRYLMDTSETATTMPFTPIVRNFDFIGAKKSLQGWTAPGYFLSNYAWQFSKIWLRS